MTRVPYGSWTTQLARREPERTALVCSDESLSFGELERRANRMARAYAKQGVGAGERVTLALPNGIELCIGCLAAWKLGAVPNPISPALPEPERAALVACADPALVVGDDAGLLRGRVGLPAGYAPDSALSDGPLPEVTAPHERALASGGSTGTPKLILPSAPASYDPEAPSPLFHAQRAVVVPGPLVHAVPFSATWQAVFGGATAVLMPRFDAAECLRLVQRHRADRLHLVPTMMLRIWRLPEWQRISYDVTSLDFVMTGGAPCPAWLMLEWIDWLGADVMHEAFGPSERIGGTFITGREWLTHPGSVGRPAAGSRVRILDPESGRELPPGELGEIHWLPDGGPGSTYHYRGARAERTADGWESVGDMGWLDGDGYLYLGDRKSDMILVGGRNLYPAEVEAVLEACPAVRSAAVIGLPDADLGSRPHAIVELAEPLDDDELDAHCRGHLAAWKRPRSYEVVDHPLRDDAGKLRRAALRQARLASGGPDSD